MQRYLYSIMLLFAGTLSAQNQEHICYYDDPGRHERNRNVDITLMNLEVRFEPQAGKVTGRVSHTFLCLQDQVDTIFLDGPGIMVSKATLDGKEIKTRSAEGGIVCETALGKAYKTSHTLVLEYTAFPKRGIYFIGWNVGAIDDPVHQTRKQIWTQGQGIDNRHWIPMIDDRGDKFVTEVNVKFDKEYKVLSNGQLLEKKDNKDGTLTWHYRINNQHAGYLLMLAIDKYAVKSTKTKRGTPIHFWYYPEHPENVEPTSIHSERIIEFLEDEIGVPYPWGSYSQVMVQDFLYGAMENTSATTFGDFFWTDPRGFLDRNYIGVNAHEATHQWFGDLITARNDADHWLQESFATFYPGLFNGSLYGPDETVWYFRGSMNGALAAGEKNDYPVRNSESGSARHYPKGASVLYMLQHQMGRDNFRRGIQLYLQRHQYSGVSTADLEKAMLDATGMNMDWFFDQWIYRGGEPHFRVSYRAERDFTEVTVEQIHKTGGTVGYFRVPVNMAVYCSDGSINRMTVTCDRGFQKFTIPNKTGAAVNFVIFDEGSFILKKLTFARTPKELLEQFQHAENFIDRYDALLALADQDFPEKTAALEAAFDKETNKHLIAEIVKQLTKVKDLNVDIMNRAYSKGDVEVRKAVINNLTPGELTDPIFHRALQDSSYQIIETALLKLWEADPYHHMQQLEPVKDLYGQSMSLKIRYLELGTEVFPDMKNQFIGQLSELCGPKYEFRTRINAMQALQRINACNTLMVGYLFDAMLSFNTRLGGPAKDVLTYFLQQNEYKRLISMTLGNSEYNEADKQRLKKSLGL